MNNYIQIIPPAYYDTLIEWEAIDQILDLIEQENQHEGYRVLSQILDYTVLEIVLSNLPQDHHNDFLELCTHQHHEPSLLNWLEERNQGISETIRVKLLEAKSEIISYLVEL